MIIGSSNSFGTVLLPFIALMVLPRNMDYTIVNLSKLGHNKQYKKSI